MSHFVYDKSHFLYIYEGSHIVIYDGYHIHIHMWGLIYI